MSEIKSLKAREILDSRGQPALEVEIFSSNGESARAGVPSGASKGKFEALELRDGDPSYFFGKGLKKAIAKTAELSESLKGMELHSPDSLKQIDEKLIQIDGTENKENLGQAATGVSLACLKLIAKIRKIPLYRLFGDRRILPVPLMNILNGGQHASNNLDIQEFMIIPHGFKSFKEALRAGAETYHSLKNLLKEKNLSTLVGDEGGLAPNLKSNEEALKLILQAIEKAGYKPGLEISLGLDAAASSFFNEGQYLFEGEKKSARDMISLYDSWIKKYPVKSIEDGLDEQAFKDWAEWTKLHGDQIQIVGDDLFVTNEKRLSRGIKEKAANALLVKINQIGTVTEAFESSKLAHQHGYSCVLSHRSGETEDTSLADLALAFECSQIKTGAPARSERTAKYNRLLRIEEEIKNSEMAAIWQKNSDKN